MSFHIPSPRSWSPAILVLFLVAPVHAAAQALFHEPAAGVRVRLYAQSGRSWEGRWVRGSADSLYLSVVGPFRPDTLAFERDAIARLERQVGTRSQTKKGAFIGGGVGGGLMLLLGVAAASGSEDNWMAPGTGDIAVLTVFGALIGAGTGALIGSASHTPIWEAFELPPPVVLPAAPGRVALLRFEF